MKIGAERNKVVVLSLLGVIAAWALYTNVFSDSSSPAPQRAAGGARAVLPDIPAVAPTPLASGAPRRLSSRAKQTDEFRPSLKRRPEDKLDPMTIDPTLRLDLLAKVQSVELEGGGRNLFQFSAPPPPPLPKGPEPKILPKPGQAAAGNGTAAPKPGGPPPKPPAPPINLKSYGFSTQRGGGAKTAFFLDGEDILVAGEGETVKRRYKVVRIGVNSVVMEDTQSKSQQTLPLAAEEANG